MQRYILILLFMASLAYLGGATVSLWNFDDSSLTPTIGSGEIYPIGNVLSDGFATGYPAAPSMGWSTTNYPAQGTNNLSAGICIEFSTLGYHQVNISWVLRHSNKSANRWVMFYTLDRSASPVIWHQAASSTVSAGDTWYPSSFNASGIAGFDNNPHLAIKIVAAFADDAQSVYLPSKSTSNYAPDGKWRWDDILICGNPITPHMEVTSDLQVFFAAPGALSPLQEYHLQGQNLNQNIQITVTGPFRIRLAGSADFSTSLQIIPRSGTVNKDIQVLFQPATSGVFTGTIHHSYPGLPDIDLEIEGTTTKPEPSNYPAGFSASQTTYYQTVLSWTDATGLIQPDGYLVLGSKVDAASIQNPVDGVVYPDKKLTKNVPYGIQSQLIFELNEAHTYYFKIFPFTNQGSVINYKTDGIVPLISVTTATGPTGSSLQPGDLAFVEYASDSPDRFSFVLLRDVLENTKINFTDKAWNGSAFAESEEVYEWRGVGRPYHAGEVIHVVEGVLFPDEGIYNPDFEGFSNNGDQIIAFQGYLTEPSFIAAFSTTDWITEGTPSNSSSYLPESLVLGETALGFATEIDNGVYQGITSGTAVQLRLAMNDPQNWMRANSLNNVTFPDQWDIHVLPPVSQPAISILMQDTQVLNISWQAVPGASSYMLYGSDDPAAVFPDAWQVINGNITDTFIELLPSVGLERQFYRVSAILD